MQELLGLEGDGNDVGVSIKKKTDKYTDKKGNEIEVESYDSILLSCCLSPQIMHICVANCDLIMTKFGQQLRNIKQH